MRFLCLDGNVPAQKPVPIHFQHSFERDESAVRVRASELPSLHRALPDADSGSKFFLRQAGAAASLRYSLADRLLFGCLTS